MNRRLWLRLHGIVFALLFLLALAALAWLSTRYVASGEWTGAGRAELSEPSRQLLSQLDDPVEVVGFVPPGHFLHRHLEGLLQRYQRRKPDFHWQLLNPEAHPGVVRDLDVQGPGELVLEYRDRREHVRVPTEAYISAALERLQRGGGGQTIAFLSGHGERDLLGQANHDLGAFGDALKARGHRLRPLRAGYGGEIPIQTQLLIIASPRLALASSTQAAVQAFTKAGGNVLWLAEPEGREHLDFLRREFGLQPLSGVVTDAQTAAQLDVEDQRFVLLEEYPPHSITERLRAPSLFPRIMAFEAEAGAAWQREPLLLPASRHGRAHFDSQGELVESLGLPRHAFLGAAFSREVVLEGATREQRGVVLGDGGFLSNTYIANGANRQLGLNIVDWLTESEVFMDIYARAAPDQRLQLGRVTTLAIALGFLLVLPGLFLMVALWRWSRRRSG